MKITATEQSKHLKKNKTYDVSDVLAEKLIGRGVAIEEGKETETKAKQSKKK